MIGAIDILVKPDWIWAAFGVFCVCVNCVMRNVHTVWSYNNKKNRISNGFWTLGASLKTLIWCTNCDSGQVINQFDFMANRYSFVALLLSISPVRLSPKMVIHSWLIARCTHSTHSTYRLMLIFNANNCEWCHEHKLIFSMRKSTHHHQPYERVFFAFKWAPVNFDYVT